MWSGDSTTTPDEIERSGRRVGHRRAVHHRPQRDPRRGRAGRRRLPCRVIVGEELRTHAGEIIGLFLTERVPFGASRHEAAAAHPRRRAGSCTSRIRSTRCATTCARPRCASWPRTTAHRRDRGVQRQDVARASQRAGGRVSPRARPARRGRERRARPRGARRGVRRDARLRRAAHRSSRPCATGVVVGHHFDRPRTWRPRIVPSTSID